MSLAAAEEGHSGGSKLSLKEEETLPSIKVGQAVTSTICFFLCFPLFLWAIVFWVRKNHRGVLFRGDRMVREVGPGFYVTNACLDENLVVFDFETEQFWKKMKSVVTREFQCVDFYVFVDYKVEDPVAAACFGMANYKDLLYVVDTVIGKVAVEKLRELASSHSQDEMESSGGACFLRDLDLYFDPFGIVIEKVTVEGIRMTPESKYAEVHKRRVVVTLVPNPFYTTASDPRTRVLQYVPMVRTL